MIIRYVYNKLFYCHFAATNPSSQWNDGRRGQDGWDRYTRRRKWYRDAELVELQEETPNASEETVSALTQALEKEKETKEKEPESESTTSLSNSTTLKSRRRRWFSSGSKEKDRASSGGSPAEVGRSTGSNVASTTDGAVSTGGRNTPARPINMANSRKQSQHSAREGSVATSDSASTREREIANSQDRLDRWATRAADGTERAEREFGLSDEVNMGLS